MLPTNVAHLLRGSWPRAVMAYKGTETDVLYGVEMAWRATPLLTRCSREASLFNCQMTESKIRYYKDVPLDIFP